MLQNSVLVLTCSAQTALDYCWFRHPSGLPLRFSTDLVDLDGNWRQYIYEDTLQQGVCTIALLYPSSGQDSGEWTCSLGSLGRSNEEYTTPITVGVSGKLKTVCTTAKANCAKGLIFYEGENFVFLSFSNPTFQYVHFHVLLFWLQHKMTIQAT